MAAARRLLVIDDDKNIRTTLRQALEGDGRAVETAADGAEGLERLRAEPFDLVLLDLKMPKMSGQDVLAEARRHRPDVPVVIITAHGDVETAVEALQAGAAHFIQKPFSVEDARELASTMFEKRAEGSPVDAPGTEEDVYEGHLQQARAAIEERDLDAAVQHARIALAHAPTRPEAFNVMGVARQLQIDVNEAQKYYRAALSLAPTYAPAQRNLDNTSRVPKRLGAFDLG